MSLPHLSTLNPWAAHFNCADLFPLVADKSLVDPICSNFVVLCIDGNIPKRLTRGVLVGWFWHHR